MGRLGVHRFNVALVLSRRLPPSFAKQPCPRTNRPGVSRWIENASLCTGWLEKVRSGDRPRAWRSLSDSRRRRRERAGTRFGSGSAYEHRLASHRLASPRIGSRRCRCGTCGGRIAERPARMVRVVPKHDRKSAGRSPRSATTRSRSFISSDTARRSALSAHDRCGRFGRACGRRWVGSECIVSTWRWCFRAVFRRASRNNLARERTVRVFLDGSRTPASVPVG
jgi:hypothetical protein